MYFVVFLYFQIMVILLKMAVRTTSLQLLEITNKPPGLFPVHVSVRVLDEGWTWQTYRQ